MAKKTDHIQAAMNAHSNLNMFYAVVELMESGSVIGDPKARSRVIAICKKEAIRQLKIMDRQKALAEGATNA